MVVEGHSTTRPRHERPTHAVIRKKGASFFMRVNRFQSEIWTAYSRPLWPSRENASSRYRHQYVHDTVCIKEAGVAYLSGQGVWRSTIRLTKSMTQF